MAPAPVSCEGQTHLCRAWLSPCHGLQNLEGFRLLAEIHGPSQLITVPAVYSNSRHPLLRNHLWVFSALALADAILSIRDVLPTSWTPLPGPVPKAQPSILRIRSCQLAQGNAPPSSHFYVYSRLDLKQFLCCVFCFFVFWFFELIFFFLTHLWFNLLAVYALFLQ